MHTLHGLYGRFVIWTCRGLTLRIRVGDAFFLGVPGDGAIFGDGACGQEGEEGEDEGGEAHGC